ARRARARPVRPGHDLRRPGREGRPPARRACRRRRDEPEPDPDRPPLPPGDRGQRELDRLRGRTGQEAEAARARGRAAGLIERPLAELAGWFEEGAAAAIAGEGRGTDLRHDPDSAADADLVAHRRRIAGTDEQLVTGRRPNEEDMARVEGVVRTAGIGL